jgi:FkbM family methyltransferase
MKDNLSLQRRAFEAAKRFVRFHEARFAWRTREYDFGGRTVRSVRSLWWNIENSAHFAAEMQPYFDAMGDAPAPKVIWDCGGALGFFSVLMCQANRGTHSFLFEPSPRQRVICERNLELNRIGPAQVTMIPYAVWNVEEVVEFRTNGDMSGVRGANEAVAAYPFLERVEARRLDDLWKQGKLGQVPPDLVKMDIEGAEVEAIEGAEQVLREHRPMCLVQAYHPRGGERTFERVRGTLDAWGFDTSASRDADGLVVTKRGR